MQSYVSLDARLWIKNSHHDIINLNLNGVEILFAFSIEKNALVCFILTES